MLSQRQARKRRGPRSADAAAMGVMEFGEGKNEKGLVMTITLGTGIGSGVFFNGELLSNFELGRLYGRKGDIMESFASDAARKRKDWDFKKWGKRLNFFFKHIEMSFNPDLIIIGGGGWLAYTLIETKEDLETEKSRRKYAEEELIEKDKE